MTPKPIPCKGEFAMYHPAESVSSSNLSQLAAERYAQLAAVAEARRKPVKRLSLRLRVKPVSVQ